MKDIILVTGGMGFIGSHTTVELIQNGYDVVIVDNLSNSNEKVIDGIERITGVKPAFENVDCCDYTAMEKIFQKYKGIKGKVKKVKLWELKGIILYENQVCGFQNMKITHQKHIKTGLKHMLIKVHNRPPFKQ